MSRKSQPTSLATHKKKKKKAWAVANLEVENEIETDHQQEKELLVEVEANLRRHKHSKMKSKYVQDKSKEVCAGEITTVEPDDHKTISPVAQPIDEELVDEEEGQSVGT